MKDYLWFAVRVNIGLILGAALASLAIVPAAYVIAFSTGLLEKAITDPKAAAALLEQPDNPVFIAMSVFVALLVFVVAYWIFKFSYRNMKMKKHIFLMDAILWCFILKVVVDVLFGLYDEDVRWINMIAAEASSLAGFYLAGRKVDGAVQKS